MIPAKVSIVVLWGGNDNAWSLRGSETTEAIAHCFRKKDCRAPRLLAMTLYIADLNVRATSENPPLPPLSKGAYARREREGIYGDYRWVSMMHSAQKFDSWRYSAGTPSRASSGMRPTSSDSRMETPCEAACSFTTSNTVRGDVTL